MHCSHLGNIAPKHSSTLKECPHSAATPTAHPRRVDTRNEICLTANEILLRKVKSNKLDEIPLCGVADERSANKQYRASVRICHAERSRSIPRKGSSFPFVTKKTQPYQKIRFQCKGFFGGRLYEISPQYSQIHSGCSDVVLGKPFRLEACT